jgi:monovalent cation:H+ antiporter, CPA1 family
LFDVAGVVLIIASLSAMISLIQPLAVRLRLPPTVLLALVGVAIGAGASFLLYTTMTDAFNEVAEPIVKLPFTSSTFLVIFLPLLLFQAALTIDVREMVRDAAPLLLLAVVAVFVATIVIGYSLSMIGGVPLLVALLVSSIVATTDPSAVIAIFRDLGAPGRLTRLIEGESLLNDAAAIVLFTILLGMLLSGQEPDLVEGAWRFVAAFGGGIVLGLAGARLIAMLLPWLGGLRSAEVTLTLALPYLMYILGEHLLNVSGVIAVVTSGLALSATVRARLSPENRTYLEAFWEQLAFWAGSLVFILASILVPRLLWNVSLYDLGLILIMVLAALAARVLVLFVLLPMLSAVKLTQKVSHAYKLVITWGGLRGAVTLALALAVTESRVLDPEVKQVVAVLATGFVLFTLFVNGLTLRPVIRLLKLDGLSPVNQALHRQVLALSLADVRDAVQDTARAYEIAPTVARSVTRPYEERIEKATAGQSLEDAISDRDRLTIGLIALANRELELVLDHHGQRTVSPRIVERLLEETSRILDGARSAGRIGYNRAARSVVAYSRAFRFAHFLHRNLGIDGLLVRELADRFEVLLVRRLVLEALKQFNEHRLRPMLGRRMAEILGEVLSNRLDATSRALDALRLQYPAHAEALEGRFLKQSALRQELEAYQDLHEEGLVGRELFDHLRRSVEAERRQAEQRPPLDLGLKTEDLIRQFDFFRGLDEKQLRTLRRLFRPRLAVPGEKIIRTGERGDRVFFVSSGAVEVILPTNRIRLGRGDFFGEMALLSRRRRQADVVALAYCHLLVLDEGDFRRFLDTNPTARKEIDRVAEARAKMNQDLR